MSDWKIRPYQSDDEAGVVFLWLNSWLSGPYGRRIGAMQRDSNGDMRKQPDIFRTAWTRYQPVVERLIAEHPPDILHMPIAPEAILAFACWEPAERPRAPVVHMAVVKRKVAMHDIEMLTDLLPLGDRRVIFTHEMPDVPATIRQTWVYDAHRLMRTT